MINAATTNINTNLTNNTTSLIKGDVENLLKHRNIKLLTEPQKNTALNRLVSDVYTSLPENEKHKIKAVLKEMPDNFTLSNKNQHLSEYMKNPTLGDRFTNLLQTTKQAFVDDKPLGRLVERARQTTSNLWQTIKHAFDDDKPLGRLVERARQTTSNLWQTTKHAFDDDKPLGRLVGRTRQTTTDLWQSSKRAFDADKPLGKLVGRVSNFVRSADKPTISTSKNRQSTETHEKPKVKSAIKDTFRKSRTSIVSSSRKIIGLTSKESGKSVKQVARENWLSEAQQTQDEIKGLTENYQNKTSPNEETQSQFLQDLETKLDAMGELLEKAPKGVDTTPFQAFKAEHEQIFEAEQEKLLNREDNVANIEERSDFNPT